LIKQGAKLVATWGRPLFPDLPGTESEWELASKGHPAASLFEEASLLSAETRVTCALRHGEGLQLDEIMEKLESELS
jgi:hypothetical protein